MKIPRPRDAGRRLALALGAVAMILVGACRPLGDLGHRSGWSVLAENTTVGIDYVIRYSAADLPVYRLLPTSRGGVVAFGDGISSATAALAVLDPVSCRVVSIVDPVPVGNVWVGISIEGTPSVSSYDPNDRGDPDASGLLQPTETCKDADPTSTPLPAPSMVAGDWLNGWEMYCTASEGGADAFAVRGEFLTGAAAGCEAHTGDSGQLPIKGTDGIAVWNPDGDTSRLGIGWKDSACTDVGTVSLYPTMEGYQAHVISIGSACKPGLQPYSVVFFLTDRIDAGRVRGEVERQLD